MIELDQEDIDWMNAPMGPKSESANDAPSGVLSEAELQEIEQIWKPGPGSTHYEGCWRNHSLCVNSKLIAAYRAQAETISGLEEVNRIAALALDDKEQTIRQQGARITELEHNNDKLDVENQKDLVDLENCRTQIDRLTADLARVTQLEAT